MQTIDYIEQDIPLKTERVEKLGKSELLVERMVEKDEFDIPKKLKPGYSGLENYIDQLLYLDGKYWAKDESHKNIDAHIFKL